MKKIPLKSELRHRLIKELLARTKQPRSVISQGFTLIELLVVVIIVGILASIALPSFLNQADKAKASAAKALVSSAVKECQVHLVSPSLNASGAPTFTPQVEGTPEIWLAPIATPTQNDPISCSSSSTNTFGAKIVSSGQTFSATLTPSTGVVAKSCSSGTGCTSQKW